MIFRMIPHVKTIDQKSKPVKKLNELPYKDEPILFKCDRKYSYYYICNIRPFTSYFNNADVKYASFNLKV